MALKAKTLFKQSRAERLPMISPSRPLVLTTAFIAIALSLTALFQLSPLFTQAAYADEGMCTIAFDSNGGSGSMLPVTTESPEKYAAPACAFTRGTDQFYAWNTAPDASGKMYRQGDALEGIDANLYFTLQVKVNNALCHLAHRYR